jgi:Tol biopolymer transport system component
MAFWSPFALTEPDAPSQGLHAEQGTYSPDGSRLVYEQRSAAAPDDIPLSNIVVARPDGSAARVVASGTDPSWCPDGTAIVFKTFDCVRRERWIATIAADGTALNGSRLAFIRTGH